MALERWRGKVHITQFLADLLFGDAVSDDCLEIDRLLHRWGFNSQIYVERMDGRYRGRLRTFDQYQPEEEELLLFHYSTWSSMAEYLQGLERPRVVLIYHNITPPEYFQGSNPKAEALNRRGRAALARFAPVTLLALGDSEYNRRELEEAGFPHTGVLPIIVDLEKLSQAPDSRVLRRFRDDHVNLFSVGRVAPNKRLEDALKTLYYYKATISPKVRFFHAGPMDTAPPYFAWLQALTRHLGLEDEVHFLGHITLEELIAYYRLAHVYLCMSEHEGFCVPLIESMHLGVPVLAYASTAVPYTLGQAGILVKEKDPRVLAELVHLMAKEKTLRAQLITGGKERVQAFTLERVESLLAGYLEHALEVAGWG